MEALVEGMYSDRVKHMLRQGGAESHSLVASQVALGEAVAVILRRGPDSARMLHGLFGLLDYRVGQGGCMPPLDGAVLVVLNELVAVVPELDMTDRAILAHALADPDASLLVTNDGAMIGNPAIAQYETYLRAQGRRNVKLTVSRPPEAFRVS